MTGELLALENITFGYQASFPPVLTGLNLSLKPGGITAILGPNGAGKTTLLYLALGWLKPWQGTVNLAGKRLGDYSRQELGRWMALVPQGEYIPFEYTLLEFALLGRAPHLPPLGMPSDGDYTIAFEALNKAGVGGMYDHSIQAMSGGERQLLLLARALAQQPRLLFLDEPTAHLDLHNKYRLINILRELHAQDVTILMTTHEPDVALAVADEVILMELGSVLDMGPVDRVVTEENLSRVYNIPIRIIPVEGKKHIQWL
jgi:iron complex transport system ATP-binding protein